MIRLSTLLIALLLNLDAYCTSCLVQLPTLSPLFSLIPLNDRARAVLVHPRNQKIFSIIGEYAIQGLSIGPQICSKSRSRYTLATLGYGDTDIKVEGPNISRTQCS